MFYSQDVGMTNGACFFRCVSRNDRIKLRTQRRGEHFEDIASRFIKGNLVHV